MVSTIDLQASHDSQLVLDFARTKGIVVTSRHPGRVAMAKLLIGLLSVIATASVEAGGQVHEIETPLKAATLSGQVADLTGAGIPDVLIERCGQGWKDCFASY
jgi:hypothetical protein